MSLCSLCSSIDLLAIPRLPSSWDRYTVHKAGSALKSILKERSLVTEASSKQDEDSEPLGIPYHPTLQSLHDSATHCPLCQTVAHDVSRFKKEWDEKDSRWKRGDPDWKMMLARSKGEIGGFLVIVRTEKKENEVWVVAAVGLSTKDDDPLSEFVCARVVEEDPSGETSINRAQGWVKKCDEEHKDIRCVAGATELPGRVINVESSGPGGVSLEETGGKSGKYAALSHNTGDESSSAILHDDIERLKEGIEVEKLPKIFQDAITMTRELGLQYLWIDSLCISQSNSPSLSRDAPEYATIFSKASIVLSATGASNDSDGLFKLRPSPSYLNFSYTHSNICGTIYTSSLHKASAVFPVKTEILRDEPLSQSAWALQERYFAPRILHFGTSQMFFECYGFFISEDGLKLDGRVESLYLDDTNPQWLANKTNNVSRGSFVWQGVVNSYCRRQLPRREDYLPGLSNLARAVQESSGLSYAAGLWRENLVEGLMWQAVGFVAGKTKEATEYRAPSWSFASIDGPFGTFCMGSGPDAGEWVDLALAEDCRITLKGDNPFGEVTSGDIVLRAPVEELLPCEDSTPATLRKQGWRMKTKNGSEKGTYCIFDTPDRADMAKSTRLEALLLAKHKSPRSEDWGYHGIVVARDTGEEKYRRLGKFVFDDEQLGQCDWKMTEDAKRIVTLI